MEPESILRAPRLFAAMLAMVLVAPAVSAADAAAPSYVAMGSSFAAGPGVDHRAEGSPPACARSDGNYAHRLARMRGLALNDVSCSGAVTANLLDTPQAGQPPEVEAVTAATTLVTITIGGNDVNYLGDLWNASCLQANAQMPQGMQHAGCKLWPPEKVEQGFRALPAQFQRIAQVIRARSPAARIVLVNYLDILPPMGECPATAPLSAADVVRTRALAARLASVTADAARANNLTLVSAAQATRGHDVCAAAPWVHGFQISPGKGDWTPAVYHPTAAAMQAIAEAIDHALGPR